MAVSNKFTQLQQIKFDIFKEQNLENGRFNVTFEVEGKLLYAHKNMLNLISDTFDAMLSDRWMKNKEEPIKITDYSYDNFHQFLTFLYSAQCQLTDENIFVMVDIAEFYGVSLFKTYCNEYLTKMEVTAENVFQLMDAAEKFTITQLKESVHHFIPKNFASVIKSNRFLNIDKSLAMKLVTDHKYIPEPEDLFVAVFNWAKQKAIDKQSANPNLNLNETIKAEICEFLPHILFCGMDSSFLHKFVVPRAYIFSDLEELSQILCDRDRFFEGKVKITNQKGQTLHGNEIPDKTILRNIESLKLMSKTSNIFG